MKEKNIKINLITIIVVLISVTLIIMMNFTIEFGGFQILLSILLIGLEIVLNRATRIMEIKEDLNKRNKILIAMAILMVIYIFIGIIIEINVYSTFIPEVAKVFVSYDIKEMAIGICIGGIITFGTILSKLFLKKETETAILQESEENVNTIDIMLLVVFICITIFSIVILVMSIQYPTSGIQPVTTQTYDIPKRIFNSNFTPYMGEKQSASQVKLLISAVEASNATNEERQVEIEPEDINTKLKASKKYSVELEYDDEGYVNEIIITEE